MLDPLESETLPAPAPPLAGGAPPMRAHERGHGVAVGLGLMSLALAEDESPGVTGTLIQTGTGEDALEVVFALREVSRAAMPFFGRVADGIYREGEPSAPEACAASV